MTEEWEEVRAWVGCLACYNGGDLTGAWVDGTEAGSYVPCQRPGHEEWWVFDFEGYRGLIESECSPSEAQRVAEVIERIEAAGHPVEAVSAWRDNVGAAYADLEDFSDFEEAFNGEHDSEEAFAEELAEELGLVPEDAGWPAYCIDWEHAARELFMGDYWSAEAPGGTVYVFRSL